MEKSDLSRRKLLGGLAVAGGAGTVVGVGTGAVLSDGARFVENRLVAGALDLRVEWDGGSSEGDASLAIDLTGDDTGGERTFTVSLPDGGSNNPAYAWLGATCPEPNPLAASLAVTLSYADCEGGDATGEVASGSLLDVADELADGISLDADGDPSTTPGSQSCLEPGDELCLRLEWDLDDGYEGEDELAFELRFVGRQCRRGDGTVNPLPGEECEDPPTEDRHAVSNVEIFTCEEDGDPERVGKLELEDDYCGRDYFGENSIEPGEYVLYDGDCDETGYVVRVTETREKADGETVGISFELLYEGEETGPDLCRVVLKGGPGTATYDDPGYFDGNATTEPLMTPTKSGGNGGNA